MDSHGGGRAVARHRREAPSRQLPRWLPLLHDPGPRVRPERLTLLTKKKSYDTRMQITKALVARCK